ncbi:MAG: sodium:proton antiporter [Bacteroidetes bacterium MED-G21]|nr:MAG: sodium:proton antiporter [Bacteroidetes bacterium MED-G21]
MLTLMIVIFVLGYLAIALEHPIKVDKAASALITGVLVWTLFVLSGADQHFIEEQLLHHLSEISSILFFLLGAMTIVELVDAHEGFSIITDKITTKNRVKLLWIVSVLTFFFSAALDNLTTTIVMVSLLRKLIDDKYERWFFAGIVVVAANAGGAWSPIGDVTTTMLWIGGQLTTMTIIKTLIVPSIVAMLVPLTVLSFTMKGEIVRPVEVGNEDDSDPTTAFERNLIFFLGVAGLLFVPVFKTLTHLPPFMGMMLSLGVLWLVTEIIHRSKNKADKSQLSVIGVLRKIDTASVLFFLGILLAVAGLQSAGHLAVMAQNLNEWFGGDIYAINIVIGLLSAIVDNVPLVAGSMGMYEITSVGNFAQDGVFWQFLAFCAGTGGSALIIGSAAGVAAMGLEKIDFVWYLKKISILALIGYFAGAGTYILMQSL